MRFPSLCLLIMASGCLFAGSPLEAGIAAPKPPETTKTAMPMDAFSDPDRFSNLPRLLLDDAGHVITAPTRWVRSDWNKAWMGTAAVLGSALLLDQAADRFVLKHANGGSDRAAKAVQNLGGAPSVLIAGGTYLAGVAFKDPEIRATGVDALATMGLAQLLLTIPLKVATGRSRPSAEQGSHDFRLFGGGQSFPSGHTTQAFALASVISAHADEPWVSGLCYGLAGLVGVARMEQRQHFLSDVVAGGLIGTFVGRTVVSYNQSRRTNARSKVAMTFAPLIQPGGYGLSVAMRF